MPSARTQSVRDAAVAGFWCGGIFGLVETHAWISAPLPPNVLSRGLASLFPCLLVGLHAAAGAAGLGLLASSARAANRAFGRATWFAIGAFLVAAGARLASILSERQSPEIVPTAIEALGIGAVFSLAAGALAGRLPADGRSRRVLAWRCSVFSLGLLMLAASPHLHSLPLGYVLGGMSAVAALVLPPPRWVASNPLGFNVGSAATAFLFLVYIGNSRSLADARIGRASKPLPQDRRATAGGPNILLVTIDALRADALGCYGNAGARTPSIDALAARAIAFERAYAAAPWTLASLAALLYGRFPSEIGVGRTGEESGRVLESFLRGMVPAPGGPGLEGFWRMTGYARSACVTNFWCDGRFGLGVAFERYDRLDGPGLFAVLRPLRIARLARRIRPELDRSSVRADEVTRAAIAELERLRGRRFFLWVHFLDPHLPYDAPASAHRIPQSMLDDLRAGRFAPSATREGVRAAYEDEVDYADRELGKLFAYLRTSRIEKETLVALTADHGEEFWEHGGFEHGHSLHDEVLRVPLLLAFPDGRHAGRRVPGTVSLLDLAPTLLEVAGQAVESRVPAASLLPLLEGNGAPRIAFSESLLYGDEAKSLRTDRWRLILRHGEAEPVVLDYARNPLGEVTKAEGNEEVRALRSTLLEWAGRMREEARRSGAWISADDAEVERALRALGYLR
ncbi:MAG TPA: sulfatase-like hydrolase/transferase [Planctomycetota bacterium]|nr:sulfatase-like hydrolase/transferase [Planctomycetota bacterium]